ncbi:hypothetical protein PMIT1318_00024 [Prochlorococcus marinus str. MIT 1318]|nr:hypothetical protein PMIT1318_00024 [Prochlorococcus marinus str. MIT 1318]
MYNLYDSDKRWWNRSWSEKDESDQIVAVVSYIGKTWIGN